MGKEKIMKKKILDILLVSSLLNTGEFVGPMIDDPKVLDCTMSMYFYMLCEDEKKKEEYFQKFDEQYQQLDESQQKQVKQEFLSIIDAQEKQQEESFQKQKTDDKKGQ